ncbi:MAG: hypothetical protein WCD28_03570 [Nitrososphaeraceae archaeon]
MTYYGDTTIIITSDSGEQAIKNSFDPDYYASHRIPLIIRSKEIGKVFADVKGNIVVIAGENRKEHEYLIPKSKVVIVMKNKFLSIFRLIL